MGFWQTGYQEFHEESGLGDLIIPPAAPPIYTCPQCDRICTSPDELSNHRFEAHPLRRPTMYLRGREVGSNTIRITRQLSADELRFEECDQATLNGRDVPVSRLAEQLAGMSFDTCRVSLKKSGVEAQFALEFYIALTEDLRGVEDQFLRIAEGRRLDNLVVEDFISATSKYSSAIGYCDGICAYLYGVLARERTGGASLPYETYVSRYSKAAEELACYDRPLANLIGSLVEFHFNHFSESNRLSPGTRAGRVSGRYVHWMRVPLHPNAEENSIEEPSGNVDSLVTDLMTERILRWAVKPLSALRDHTVEIESGLNADIEDFDRTKLHILLAELYADNGESQQSIRHAKALRNVPALEAWAEAFIEVYSSGGRR